MQSTICAFVLFFSCVFCQQNGSYDQNLPTVHLTGESWVVGRKIHRGKFENIHPELQRRETDHLNDGVRNPVNVRLVDPNSYPIAGQRVVVYTRIIHPPQGQANSRVLLRQNSSATDLNTPNDRIISQWIGNLGDGQHAYERDTLLREAPVDN